MGFDLVLEGDPACALPAAALSLYDLAASLPTERFGTFRAALAGSGEGEWLVDPAVLERDLPEIERYLAGQGRPFCRSADPVEPWFCLDSLVQHDYLPREDFQLVTEWHRFGTIDRGFETMRGERGCLVASKGELHLVAAPAGRLQREARAGDDWRAHPRVSGTVLEWSEAVRGASDVHLELRADGAPRPDAPRPFRRFSGHGNRLWFAEASLLLPWKAALEAAAEACRIARSRGARFACSL